MVTEEERPGTLPEDERSLLPAALAVIGCTRASWRDDHTHQDATPRPHARTGATSIVDPASASPAPRT